MCLDYMGCMDMWSHSLQYFSDDKKIQQEPCIAFLLENVFFLLVTKTSRIIIMHLKIIVVIDNGKR